MHRSGMHRSSMHGYDEHTEELARMVVDYVLDRRRTAPPPLDGPRPPDELTAATGQMITSGGIGFEAAMALFRDVLAPACISSDHPRYLAFVPTAPTEAATFFDLVVSAANIYGDWWLEGAGAIHAELQTLRWLADLAGMPAEASGVFLSGGTSANLTALTVARETWRRVHSTDRRAAVLVGPGAHSSVRLAAKVTDVPVLLVPPDDRDRLTGERLREVVEQSEIDMFAVMATGGATNTGLIDDLPGIADVCAEHGLWLHVDCAYGGAAMASTLGRPKFEGIERADSFVVDPHKWLFAPFDCAALVYRDPSLARQALSQHAAYLDPLDPTAALNPSDLGVHMTRRVRGLPLWFSLTAHGTAAYDDAVTRGLELATAAARRIDNAPHLELVMEPELSVVLFRRLGFTADDYQAWSDRALESGLALVEPTTFRGETVYRFCFVNPTTSVDDIDAVIAAMA
ncbi:MAG: pyridoxal phosphate-dependent decarboxylase family protein [Ilumatobacteraceae bacterium]